MLRLSDELLAAKIQIQPHSECWIWMGALHHAGYGHVTRRGGARRVHRYVYEMLVGEIPRGLVLDHLCRTRACCNPAHLEPVTQAENLRRGAQDYAGRTHCKHGHEFTAENTNITPQGARQCRECNRIKQRSYYRRRRIA